MKRVLLVLAEGFEEVEAVTPIDYLRRAGIEVTVAGLDRRLVKGAHGISIEATCLLEDATLDYDGIVLPGGGPGTKRLAESERLISLVRSMTARGKLIAAICAAPALVLGKAAGILAERTYTCFPGMEAEFQGGRFSTDRVVVDGTVITSRSAGTAGEFAVAIVRYLSGDSEATALSEKILLAPR